MVAAGVVESLTVDAVMPRWLRLTVTTAVMLALAFRRGAPLLVLLSALAGIVTIGGPDTPFVLFGAMVIACYTAGKELEGRRALVGLLVAVGPAGLGLALDGGDAADLTAIAVLYGGPWVVGRLVQEQTRRADDANARAAALEHADEERLAQAAADERARIARELHDVISHSISVITVQTQAVRRRLRPDQEAEARDLAAVESTARQAMVELRRLFGVLRADGERAPLAPQPGLDQLPRLLERTREANLPVDLHVEGERVPLSPGIDLTAYRIIQESVTNVLKHAADSRVTVTLDYAPAELGISVVDDGRRTPRDHGAGHGLVGMRERVALFGGRLDVGPRPGGGFAVHAVLPLDPGGGA
jgi:signal transduction histidine kinase